MNAKLTAVLLNSRQFVGVLLVLFSLAALVAAVLAPYHAPTDVLAAYASDVEKVERLGFLPPSLDGWLPALTGATAFLAAFHLWLCRRNEAGSHTA